MATGFILAWGTAVYTCVIRTGLTLFAFDPNWKFTALVSLNKWFDWSGIVQTGGENFTVSFNYDNWKFIEWSGLLQKVQYYSHTS